MRKTLFTASVLAVALPLSPRLIRPVM